MAELVRTFQHLAGEAELIIHVFKHTLGEFSYRSTIKVNGKVIVQVNSNIMTNASAFFDSFEARIKDFYAAYGDANENGK